MVANPTQQGGLRVSLRELMALFAAVAGACAALKYANQWWQTGVVGAVLLAVLCMAATAVVDRGPRQAFAIGFVVFSLGYGGLVYCCRETINSGRGSRTMNSEIEDPFEGRLPTTISLSLLHEQVAREMWRNLTTDQLVVASDLPDDAVIASHVSNITGGFRYTVGQKRLTVANIPSNVYKRMGDRPALRNFMLVGHGLWTLLLGYVGGKYTQLVYSRRVKGTRTKPLK